MEANTGAANPAQATSTQQATEGSQPANTSISGAQGAKEGQAPSAVKDAAQEAMRKFKVKVEGQELEVDENELVRGYSHQRAANKALQEGKALRKQAETFVSMLKDETKLFDVLKKVGHDDGKLRKLAESFLTEKIKYDMLDDREKELLKLKHENEQFKELERRQKEEIERKRSDEMKRKFSEEYSKQFIEVLKTEKIPANKATVAEMAKYIHWAAKNNFDMTPQEAAKLVREDIEARARSIIGDSDAEFLIKMIGEENVQKIRAHDVQKIRNPEQFLRTPEVQGDGQRRNVRQERRMTPSEWRKDKYGI